MQVGGAGSTMSEINVTPLIDVVLVLLIIFMVITPVTQMGYLVKVPPKAPEGLPPQVLQDQIILRYTGDQRIFINQEQVAPDQFAQRFGDILKGNTSKMVFFSGSSDANYGETMAFLDRARSAGANNIGIIVEELGGASQALD